MVIGYAGVLPHDQIKAMIESRLDMFPECNLIIPFKVL